MEILFTIAAWIWVLLAFGAGIQGLRQSIKAPGTRSYARAIRFCASLCILLAACAIIASAVVKIAVR